MTVDPRTPVLVGVGTSHADAEALLLMVEAAHAAGEDSGADLLGCVDRIAVTKGTWSYRDPGRYIGLQIGAPAARTALVEVGIPQQTVIDEILVGIRDGELDVALVVGGESRAHDARLRSRSAPADAQGIADAYLGGSGQTTLDLPDTAPDDHQFPEGDLVDEAEITAGLWAPVEQYAILENALAAAEGRSPDQVRDELAALLERCSQVARSNPEAAFASPMDADDIRAFGPGNRPLAFPYAKWHASQWTVDQAAALLLCTAEVAEAAGVPRDRWIFPLVGLGSSHMLPVTRRAELHRWPAMRLLGEAAAAHLGHPLADIELVDLYSCFPVAVRVQQRELGLSLDRAPTITGGMSFAGGPFNSYVFGSTAAAARLLRERGGRALVTSVSGLLTKPGLAVWGSDPGDRPLLVTDLASEARDATATVQTRSAATGTGTVASYTVTYTGQDAADVICIVDLADATRTIARTSDPALVAAAISEGIVGRDLALFDGQISAASPSPG